MADSPDAPDDPVTAAIERDIDAQRKNERPNQRSVYSCPDCGGALWEFDEGFACHTGHRWSPEALLTREGEELRAALQAAVRIMKERATLLRQVANKAATDSEAGRLLREQADTDEQHAALIDSELL